MAAYATPEPITATLTTAGARVRVTASDRPDTVVLVEPVDRTSKTDVKVAEKTEVGFSAGQLSVRTTKSGDKNGSVAITIALPAGSKLVLNTAWTDVHADGRLGDCELHTASGRVELDHVAALRGNLGAGDVGIGHVTGTVDIEGGAAGVRLGEVDGTVRYRGSTGPVWVGHAKSDVELSGASGSFDIDRAEGGVTAEAGDCPIRVGRITRGHADLTNAAGGIEVGVADGATATADARSTKGQVRNSLTEQDNPAAPQVTIHARTRRDDIVIHRAAG